MKIGKEQWVYFLTVLCLLIGGNVCAQDFGFGFADDDDFVNSAGVNKPLAVSIGGEVSASMVGYLHDFSEGLEQTQLGDIFSGKLNFSAETSLAEGVINLNLNPSLSPVSIDEAYVRAYIGSFDITAGLRKLTWGKADSFGPLDVINPLDYSQVFTEMADSTSLMGVKIARPLVHASFRFGDFSKVEGVFIPWFEPHYIASQGRWTPVKMKTMSNPTIPISMPLDVDVNMSEPAKPDTTTLDYAQIGLRFTTTVGPADIGAQYYYGRLPQPAAKITANVNYIDNPALPFPVPSSVDVDTLFKYNPYHQIGVDYAQVLYGFNLRAELTVNITEDLSGDDGSVYNPSIAWSLGFDRDIALGINLNLQVNESIRLMHNKLGSKDISLPDLQPADIANIENIINDSLDNFDIEGGSKLTATRLTATASKKFLRDQLELRAALVWGLEDKDFAFFPALIWTKDVLRVALSGGFFAGDSEGQLGQYKDNRFIKIALAYMF
jgi:hypothetical protein